MHRDHHATASRRLRRLAPCRRCSSFLLAVPAARPGPRASGRTTMTRQRRGADAVSGPPPRVARRPRALTLAENGFGWIAGVSGVRSRIVNDKKRGTARRTQGALELARGATLGLPGATARFVARRTTRSHVRRNHQFSGVQRSARSTRTHPHLGASGFQQSLPLDVAQPGARTSTSRAPDFERPPRRSRDSRTRATARITGQALRRRGRARSTRPARASASAGIGDVRGGTAGEVTCVARDLDRLVALARVGLSTATASGPHFAGVKLETRRAA